MHSGESEGTTPRPAPPPSVQLCDESADVVVLDEGTLLVLDELLAALLELSSDFFELEKNMPTVPLSCKPNKVEVLRSRPKKGREPKALTNSWARGKGRERSHCDLNAIWQPR